MDKKMKELGDIIVGIKDRKIAIAFLKDILTPNEIEDILLRIQIIKLLNAKIPQREIAKKLKVSLCKITRGSRQLKYGHESFKKLL